MSEPFLAEIKLMSFNFPPRGWAYCNGQLLPINQNQALFSLLGTMYGGNGQTNFALPDLRGRVPAHFAGSGHSQGTRVGSVAHTLTIQELPAHAHAPAATSAIATSATAQTGFLPARSAGSGLYGAPQALTAMDLDVSATGGSQPHENRQPFLALTFCIALQGIFPSPS